MVDGARVADVAQELAEDRGILSLKLTSGARDLLAIVVAPDLDALAEYLTERVSLIPGVRATRPHVVTAAPF
jgi:DNA-binding Lrp family transcriptional regulator